ncbi:YveK family protein [Listeria sp. PSOL-1]|uniref:YveK family protein n=1 Tax=Listeria sp. PSOL-1 TaxID=1844999 RepID=UPI0013D87FE5|nr:Wzz/FepE/Etk N-terminal domain-containing protein [Listeria sp. PSOL-1]
MIENRSFDLESLTLFVKKWSLLVLIFLVLGGLIGVCTAKYIMTPIYASQSQIVIQQKNAGFTISDVQSNIQLVNTYKMIVTSPEVIEKARKQLKLSISKSTLSKHISVENSQDSQVLTVNVLDANAKQAQKINEALLKETSIQSENILGVNGVRILTSPTQEKAPAKPNVYLVTGIGMIVGLFISMLLILLWEFTHQTIRNEQDVQKLLDISHLGNVDHF